MQDAYLKMGLVSYTTYSLILLIYYSPTILLLSRSKPTFQGG